MITTHTKTTAKKSQVWPLAEPILTLSRFDLFENDLATVLYKVSPSISTLAAARTLSFYPCFYLLVVLMQ